MKVRMQHRRATLAASAAMAALLAAGSASAQNAAAVEEVVVTAQKREQALIEVPQSISVVSGDTLERRTRRRRPSRAPQTRAS